MLNDTAILCLLKAIATGETTPDEALKELRFAPVKHTLEGVTLDGHRALRTGFGETVLAQGKSLPALLAAVNSLWDGGQNPVLATRVAEDQAKALLKRFPEGQYWPGARLFSLGKDLALTPPWPREGDLVVMSAGASDAPVALEALGTARFCGIRTAYAPDVGVSGLHRLAAWLDVLDKAKVIIVAAGMEGALPSVVAGMARRPVLAVPTSVGYGAAHGGYAALLGMLSSCSPGIAVLNIDNGYGAAMFAAKMLADHIQPSSRPTQKKGRPARGKA